MTSGQTSSCRVALCDDVDGFRKVLRLVFDLEQDIEVVGEASNGREAIDLVRNTSIDVLVLDVAMPEMDGIEALPQIIEAAPGVKVIMLTGFGTARIREQVLSLGACRYLEKGLDPMSLVDAVRDVCCA